MRRIFAVLPAVALATALLAQAPPSAKTATPRPAGEFVIHMPDGTQKLLSSYKGKIVVIAFMYTTCPHCQHAAGILSKIQTDYAAKGAQVLGVVFDQSAQRDVGTFDKLYATTFPCGYSTPDQVVKFMHADGDYYVPMMAFIDKTGTLRTQVVSYGEPNGEADKFLGDQEDANIRKEIDKLLKPAVAAAPKQAPKP
jgi:peroxiredoxin